MRRPKVSERTGQQIGNYRLVALLGQGGYAEVYLGQHVRFNQQAAIKVLHAHLVTLRLSISSKKQKPSQRSLILRSSVSSISMYKRVSPFWCSTMLPMAPYDSVIPKGAWS